MRLMKYVAVSEPYYLFVLGPATLDLKEGPKWQPDRLGLFVEPRKFNEDKEGAYWCLLTKADAAAMHRDWVEDPRYTEDKPNGQNYFKNQVDQFKEKMESRTW